jgi:PAS domain S-box-containing protein
VLLLQPTADDSLLIVDANEAALKAHQYSREELLGKSISLLDREISPALIAERMRLLLDRGQATLQLRHVRKDGSVFDVECRVKIVRIGEKQLVLSIERDITERLRAEEEREKLQAQLLQVQKMESVGRLAGGVAHDFNNMLGVIIGHAELAMEQLQAGGKPRECLQEILSAALRSSDLTRQLLAFARRQVASPKILDLNDAVESMLKMLRRLIGENIELNWKPGLDLWLVFLDPTHFGQILTNLAVNARDAIRGTGALSMETANVVLDAGYCASHLGSVPGDYVLLVVSDTGNGMGQEVMEHMFEPFFTTRAGQDVPAWPWFMGSSSRTRGSSTCTASRLREPPSGSICREHQPGAWNKPRLPPACPSKEPRRCCWSKTRRPF